MQSLSLNGDWQVCEVGTESWYSAVVPGVIHQDLERAGVLSPMAWRDNEGEQQWVGERDWEYCRHVSVEEGFLRQERIVLHCSGLDTLSEIRVNGVQVMRTDNMFRAWECDVKGVLVAGDNEIRVLFRSVLPVMAARESERHLPSWNVYRPDFEGRGWVRKMGCSFGWDWGPMAVTCGIFGDIELRGYDGGRLEEVEVRQWHRDDGDVDVTIRVRSDFSRGGMMLCGSVSPDDGSEPKTEVLSVAERGVTELRLRVARARKWWPNGLGKQNLYRVSVVLCDDKGTVVDRWERRMGFRTLVLDRHQDEWGESFQFKVNGKAFFVKGANWIPGDVLIPRMTRSRYACLLRDAADANMNMLRVWGGGFYEKEEFYDLCDELGLLVWQDFMFACGTYPTFDGPFMENCRNEFELVLRRLRSHPCMALLCGNNELEQGLVAETWNEYSMSWSDYSKLFDTMLPEICRRLAPELPYWPGSPHTPKGDRRDFNNPTCGDAHCWTVWFGGRSFEDQREWNHRFMSEFGFQSFPELKTVKSFTAVQDRNLTSYVMDYHQRSANGNRKIFSYLLDRYQMPEGLEETLWMTQITQGMCIQMACEHARRQEPRMMGVMYWQLNDIWPCASWSSIDYFGRWKALQYMARRFFAPVTVTMLERPREHVVELHVSNTTFEDRSASVSWRLTDLKGTVSAMGTWEVRAPAQANVLAGRVLTEEAEAALGVRNLLVFAELSVDGAIQSRSECSLVVPKHLDLWNPELEVTALEKSPGVFGVRLRAEHPALMVRLELTEADCRFSDNFLNMYGGEVRELEACPGKPLTFSEFSGQLCVRSLIDSFRRRE